MSDLEKAARLALEALDLAQNNLRPHGDNCFLRYEGEYDRCFCGKDSLSDYLQSVVEKLDEALVEQPEPQEPVDWEEVAADYAKTIAMMKAEQEAAVLAEREACAQVCDDRDMGDCNREDMEARACAAAIRERNNP